MNQDRELASATQSAFSSASTAAKAREVAGHGSFCGCRGFGSPSSKALLTYRHIAAFFSELGLAQGTEPMEPSHSEDPWAQAFFFFGATAPGCDEGRPMMTQSLSAAPPCTQHGEACIASTTRHVSDTELVLFL